MKKSKSKEKSSAPAAQSEKTYIDNTLVSARTPVKGGYEDRMYFTPDERRAYDTAQKSFADLLGEVEPALDMSDEDRQRTIGALVEPQKRRLQNEYFKTMGQAESSANASGMLNSVGFENFRTNQLQKNYAEGLADIENQAYLQSLEVPRMRLAPILDALGIYEEGIQGPTSRGLSLLEPSLVGSQQANNFALAQNQLEKSQPQQRRSFFGSLFG